MLALVLSTALATVPTAAGAPPVQCSQTEACTMVMQPTTQCIMASKPAKLAPKPYDNRPNASLYRENNGHR